VTPAPAGAAVPGPRAGAGRVAAVCVTFAVKPDGPHDLTGIDKRPVASVRVHGNGVERDSVLDTRDHGGPFKAVYAYAQEDADWWSQQLGREVTPGWFGENLRLSGVDLVGAVVGERWRVGPTVELEVTQPRTPCATFQRHTGEPQWVRRFAQAARTGAYLRVRVPGEVRPGDEVAIVHRPDHGVTVGRWYAGQDPHDARALLAAEAAGQVLAPELVGYVERSLRHEAQRSGPPPA
jgi:MOSC domain-containing protein YiiM